MKCGISATDLGFVFKCSVKIIINTMLRLLHYSYNLPHSL